MKSKNFLLICIIAFALISFVFTSQAEARHKRELALELAKQFKFYDLSQDLLLKELERKDVTQKYLLDCALAYYEVCGLHANELEDAGKTKEAEDLRIKGRNKIEEFAGDDDEGKMYIAGSYLTEANNLVSRADLESEPSRRDRLISDARGLYEMAKKIYQEITMKYVDRQRQGELTTDPYNYEQGEDDPRFKEAVKISGILKLSWYYWAQSMYFLGKIGVNREENFDEALRQTGEIPWEFPKEAIEHYALLLQGDIYLERKQYTRVISVCAGVLTVPLTDPNWGSEAQKQADDVRQEAYYKISRAYFELEEFDKSIEYLRRMIEGDYPEQTNAFYVKFGRLLLAEAMIKKGEDPIEIIDKLRAFRQDPQQFFRHKYYDVLASIGRYPELNLQTRLTCARAAHAAGRLMDAIPIYQTAINQITSETDFERYGPEIYWRIGESFEKTWRFAEAATIYLEAAPRFIYLYFKYKDARRVPQHFSETFFPTIEAVKTFALRLARQAELNTRWIPESDKPGTQGYELQTKAKNLVAAINLIGGTTLEAERTYLAIVTAERYTPARERYDRTNKREASFHTTVAGFSAVTSIIGEFRYLQALYFAADLMKIMYNLKDQGIDRSTELFLEDTNWPESEQFPLGTRNYKGREFWSWEKSRIGESILIGITEEMRELIEYYIDQVLEITNPREIIKLYFYKTAYLQLKYIFEYLLLNKPTLETIDPDIFNKKIPEIIGQFSRHQSTRFERGNFQDITLQNVMKNFSYICFDFGLTLRSNPWSNNGYIVADLERRKERLHRDSDEYKKIEKELAECSEISAKYQEAAIKFWHNYSENFSIFYEDAKDPDNHASQQRIFKVRMSLIIYFGFYMKVRFGKIDEAEKDLFNLDRIFAEEIAAGDETLLSWREAFIRHLAREFKRINMQDNREFISSRRQLDVWRSKLLSNDRITIGELQRAFDDFAIEEWTDQDGVVHYDKKTLMDSLVYPDRDEYRIVDNIGFSTFIKEVMALWTEWAGSNDLIKIEDYCKRFAFDLREELRFHYERERSGLELRKESLQKSRPPDLVAIDEINKRLDAISSKDFVEIFAGDLLALASGSESAIHPVATKIYDNFLIECFKDRYFIANAIFSVMEHYRSRYIRLSRKSAEYLYQDAKNRLARDSGALSRNELRSIGRELLDAGMFAQAIDFLQMLMDEMERNRTGERARLNIMDEKGEPIPIDSERPTFRIEITVRAEIGQAYFQEAISENLPDNLDHQKKIELCKYSPDSRNWQMAEYNLARLFDFIIYLNVITTEKRELQQISWERTLYLYYYQIMDSYLVLLDKKAEYMRDNPGKYVIDVDIRAKRYEDYKTSGKVVGEDLRELESVEAAYWTWERALWICHYYGSQSPRFSPDERKYRYLETFRLYLKIAGLGQEQRYTSKLQDAWGVFVSLLGSRDRNRYIFFNDPEFDTEFKKVVKEIEDLAKLLNVPLRR